MSRSSMLVLLGTLTILAPLSGFPMAFRSLVTIACGALVVAIGLRLRTHLEPVNVTAPETDVREPEPHHPPAGVSPI